MSSLNLADFTTNTRASFIKISKPLIENPIKLAVVIVAIILLIYLYANDQENPKIKIIFWSFLVITPILFLHDKLIGDSVRETQKTNMESFIGGLQNPNNISTGMINTGREQPILNNGAFSNQRTTIGAMELNKPKLPSLNSANRERNSVAPIVVR